MLSQMTPDEFRERYAHYIVDPWGDEWRQTATIAAAVHDAIGVYMAAKAKVKPRFLDRWLFIPVPEWLRKLRSDKQYMSDEESEQNLR